MQVVRLRLDGNRIVGTDIPSYCLEPVFKLLSGEPDEGNAEEETLSDYWSPKPAFAVLNQRNMKSTSERLICLVFLTTFFKI